MILKQVIHYPETNSIEAAWTDADGKQVKCHSYADVQMQMLKDDVAALGGNISEHEAMIAAVEAAIVPYVPPVLTPEQIIAAVTQATQARLDAFAQTRNYDSILSACTYATSSVPKFAAEGQAAVDARDATWAALYALMVDVQTGTRPMPESVAAALAMLPEMVWPA